MDIFLGPSGLRLSCPGRPVSIFGPFTCSDALLLGCSCLRTSYSASVILRFPQPVLSRSTVRRLSLGLGTKGALGIQARTCYECLRSTWLRMISARAWIRGGHFPRPCRLGLLLMRGKGGEGGGASAISLGPCVRGGRWGLSMGPACVLVLRATCLRGSRCTFH